MKYHSDVLMADTIAKKLLSPGYLVPKPKLEPGLFKPRVSFVCIGQSHSLSVYMQMEFVQPSSKICVGQLFSTVT